MSKLALLLVVIVYGAVATSADAAPASPITLKVDLTDTTHRVYRVVEDIPAAGTAMTLYSPRWIPGHNAPTGKIGLLADLKFSVRGVRLNWRRDPLDSHAFHIELPTGAKMVRAEFVVMSAFDKASGPVFSSAGMVRLQWDMAVLYPAGRPVAQIQITPSVIIPRDWFYATAMTVASTSAAPSLTFETTNLERLVDSPVYAAKVGKLIDLTPSSSQPVRLAVFAETPADIEVSPAFLRVHQDTIAQVLKLFGPAPYRSYIYLAPVGGLLSGVGLEHQASSEDSLPKDYFSDIDETLIAHDRLPHEYIHVWNGKFRRPAGLRTTDFQQPMNDSLLWVYEGLTKYLDKVLAARGGLWPAALTEQDFAELVAQNIDNPGRAWRSLQDTTNDPIIATSSPWPSLSRSYDYYDIAALMWLEADAKIRLLSHGRRSLDDFVRTFFDITTTRAHRAYDFADIVSTLNTVQPYDWTSFLHQHLDFDYANDPATALTAVGYRLVYSETPSEWTQREEKQRKALLLSYSLGVDVGDDGEVKTVMWDSPAFKAGLSPEERVLQVDGEVFSPQRLLDAIAATKEKPGSIRLNVERDGTPFVVDVAYGGGLRYPNLERVSDQPDVFSQILAPLP
jgi:predicted metalloprotease with PDZ domain